MYKLGQKFKNIAKINLIIKNNEAFIRNILLTL